MKKKSFLIIPVIICIIILVLSVTYLILQRFNILNLNNIKKNPLLTAQIQPKDDQIYTYAIKNNATYKVIDNKKLSLIFNYPILNIQNNNTFDYYKISKDKDNLLYKYAVYNTVNNKDKFESNTYSNNVKYSPDSKYNIEIITAQYYGGMRLIVRNSQTRETIRNLLMDFGQFYWIDNNRIVFSGTTGNCVKVDPIGGQSCEIDNKTGISIYDISNNILQTIWEENIVSSITNTNLYSNGDNIYFTKEIIESNLYHQSYSESIKKVNYQYSVTEKKLTIIGQSIYDQITNLLKKAHLYSIGFSISNYPYKENTLVIKLINSSSESNFYLLDLKDPNNNLIFLTNARDLFFSKVDLQSSLALKNPNIINTLNITNDDKFRIYTDSIYGYSYNVPLDWINITPTSWLPGDLLDNDIYKFILEISPYISSSSPKLWNQQINGHGYNVEEETHINGYDAYKVIKIDSELEDDSYTIKNNNTIVFFTFRKTSVLSYSSPPIKNDYSKYSQDFENIVRSIKFY